MPHNPQRMQSASLWGATPGRRDDLESLVYSLLELWWGQLPWMCVSQLSHPTPADVKVFWWQCKHRAGYITHSNSHPTPHPLAEHGTRTQQGHVSGAH